MTAPLRYRSYAKLNLYLDVLNKRPDGYHNIETIFQSISLADELQFELHPTRLLLTCSSHELDTGENNLVYRAAMLLKERTGCRLNARIHLQKNIPLAAGLAGGSGNAAAALIALNLLWELKLSPEQLHALALELGSDVPFCLVGGTVAATGRGEQLRPLAPLPRTWFILLHPKIAVSTIRVYNSEYLEHADETPVDGFTPSFRSIIDTYQEGKITRSFFNRLERPVFITHPILQEYKDALRELGCTTTAMSGSGATIFGLVDSRKEADIIVEKCAQAFKGVPVSIVSTVSTGVERD